jgi:hypothetical protein
MLLPVQRAPDAGIVAEEQSCFARSFLASDKLFASYPSAVFLKDRGTDLDGVSV